MPGTLDVLTRELGEKEGALRTLREQAAQANTQLMLTYADVC
jgi:hypothetical protein